MAGVTDSSVRRQRVDQIGEVRMPIIAWGENRRPHRPRYGQRRIVPGDADLAGGIVEVGRLVLDLGGGADDGKPVREPAGMYICLKLSAVRATPTQWPNVGDPRRTSTATSKISPSITRISFA